MVEPSALRAHPPHLTGPAEADVVVVAVTYNSADVVERFLDALPAALAGIDRAAVVIVDNASVDRTLEVVREHAPWATVVEAGANVGYGAAINLGLAGSDARDGYLVLNPDTVPAPGSVRLLRDAVVARPGTGIAVPAIVDEDGRLRYSLRREPTIPRMLGMAVLGGTWAARAGLSEEIRHGRRYVDGGTADWATGAAMFLARRTVERVGQWDERFFLYSEETDFALRARDLGMVLRYAPGARVTHRGGDLSTSPALWSLMTLNRVRLYRKRHRRLPSTVYAAALVLNEGLRAARGRATSRAALRALLRGGALAHGGGARPTLPARRPISGRVRRCPARRWCRPTG